jgi:hypothetical protein
VVVAVPAGEVGVVADDEERARHHAARAEVAGAGPEHDARRARAVLDGDASEVDGVHQGVLQVGMSRVAAAVHDLDAHALAQVVAGALDVVRAVEGARDVHVQSWRTPAVDPLDRVETRQIHEPRERQLDRDEVGVLGHGFHAPAEAPHERQDRRLPGVAALGREHVDRP